MENAIILIIPFKKISLDTLQGKKTGTNASTHELRHCNNATRPFVALLQYMRKK